MSVRGIVSFHDPRRLRLRWWSLRWAPVHRLDVGGKPAGLVWREGGAWYAAPWDASEVSQHTTKDAAQACLLRSVGLEGAVVPR